MMKKMLIRIMIVFLLFSVSAETFSSLFFTNKEQVSFGENEEQGNDAPKAKEETKKEDGKDKFFSSENIMLLPVHASSLYAGFLHPELIARRSDPPEIPPKQS